MRLEDWLPIYHQIVADFGFSSGEDDRAARLMHELGKDKLLDVAILEQKITGKKVAVIGYAVRKEELEMIKTNEEVEVVITAGKALVRTREIDNLFTPHIHVTDMEEQELILEIKDDCLLVLHAHGDNMDKIDSIVPQIPSFVGTTQNRPFNMIYNFGGFTDGDRAALLAQEMGASHITLYGFDLDNAYGVKARKLKWASKILKSAGIM
ncbi:MAG: 6-hydroxymethylpterin diphosphokinase MptE-like protein [Archaeoglobaceae archaeon]